MLSDPLANWRNEMTELAQNRVDFIEHLHEAFIMREGHGAFAYISITDAMSLFAKYLDSTESIDTFISQFVRTH